MSKTKKLILSIISVLIFSLIFFILLYNKKFFSIFLFIFLSSYVYFLTFFLKGINKKNIFSKRIRIAESIILFLMIIIFLRLIQIQLLDRNKYISMMNNQIMSLDKEEGERGIIFDRTGKKLAFNKRLYTIHIDPTLLNEDKYSENLMIDLKLLLDSGLTKLDKNIINELKTLAKNNKKYKVLAKNIDDETKDKILEIFNEYYKKQGKKSHKTLIKFDKSIERVYYRPNEYEKLIGMVKFTDDSNSQKIGISGIEKKYEDYLVERKRVISKLYGLNKKTILPLSKDIVYSDLSGKNLHLTVDLNINYILNEEVKAQFDETNAREAYGIVMDPNNGRILGISAYSRDRQLVRNNIFQSQYEPGSIFKPIIVAAALNEGLIKKDSKFDVGDGTILKHRKTIKESSKTTRGIISTKEVVMKSSNVGMVLIAERFSEKEFEGYLKKFGLYSKTGVDFPNELKPYTTPYEKWDKLKKFTMAFGQGIAITPIQMISAFSAVVNGGTLYRPFIVEKITDNDGTVIMRNVPQKIEKVISEEVSEQVREMMKETVNSGTGKRAYIEGYSIGGKTGTAQLSAGKSGYEKQEYLSSFVGFFPAEKPRYVVLTMFMRPQAEEQFKKFGGYVAAPVVGRIASRIYKADKNLSQSISHIDSIKNIENNEIEKVDNKNLVETNVMPNLIGLSSREVIEIFKTMDLDIEIKGIGLVSEQFPAAEESLENVKKIKVILK